MKIRILIMLVLSLVSIKDTIEYTNDNTFLQLPFEADWRTEAAECFKNELISNKPGFALSIVEAIRIRLCIKNNKTKFITPMIKSIDSLTKCSKNESNDLAKAFKFIGEHGLFNDECYVVECNVKPECLNNKKISLSSFKNFESDGPIMQEILFEGPVIGTIDVYEDFLTYTGGVYKHQTGNLIRKETVLIVGYFRNFEEETWICMANYGASWGEKGYFRINFGYSDIEKSVISFEPIAVETFLE